MDNKFIHLYKKMHPKRHIELVEMFLSQKDKIIHEIKDFTILKADNGYYLINKQSKNLEYFDEEIQAIDKALDFYKSSKNIQKTIFE